jgi:hypothetical protein
MELDATAILAIVSVIVSVGGSILAVCNHQRCRSNCFGKKLEVSLDIEQTTPPTDKMEIKVPADSKV